MERLKDQTPAVIPVSTLCTWGVIWPLSCPDKLIIYETIMKPFEIKLHTLPCFFAKMFMSVKILITFHAIKLSILSDTLFRTLVLCWSLVQHIIVITWLWRNPIVILHCEICIESGSQACNSSQDSSMRRTRYISQSSTTRSSVNLLSKVGCFAVLVFAFVLLSLSFLCVDVIVFAFLCIVCMIAFWYYASPILTIKISVTKIGLMDASQTSMVAAIIDNWGWSLNVYLCVGLVFWHMC